MHEIRRWMLAESELPIGFYTYDYVYHGTSANLEPCSFFPQQRYAYFGDDISAVSDYYGRYVYKCYIRQGIKTADLFDPVYINLIVKKFGNPISKIIRTGKLWRNKPLERNVINFLFETGYQCITMNDEIDEEGGEFTAYIVANPHENVFVDTNVRR